MTTTTSQPHQLDANTLAERLSSSTPPHVLDVRTPAEFETSHIPGSYNVPLDTLREHKDELSRHVNGEVVLVCKSGGRSTEAEEALADAGLQGMHVLDGGMDAWESTDAPLERGRQTWELERQVRLLAGGIVLTSVVSSAKVPALKWVAGAIGAGLAGAALTNSCAMGMALSKMPWNQTGPSCDIDEVLAALADDTSQ